MMQLATDIVSFTCICCPLGCPLEVAPDDQGAVAEVAGHGCKRGAEYALREATSPERMVTTTVIVQGRLEPISVKTAAPVPKKRVAEVLEAIAAVRMATPIEAGAVVIDDVCGTGVAVIATKSAP